MSLSSGTRLGAYAILDGIGAGGMGEVYRATDTRLGRDVAIKVLPAEVAQDDQRLARFEREARLLAALNHPNIAHVYGFEKASLADGSSAHFLAMELVPGEDLAERLQRGPIPLEEALPLALQIAEALEEAHEKGIVHRDLKPGNVKLTPDGKVKVLDFGLAKAYEEEGGAEPDLSQSPTLTHAATQAGVILGTAAYMSPEQARGKRIDKRSDIWAFGVVLYEMLAGKPLFAGESVAETLALIFSREVDLGVLPPGMPGSLRRLLRRCLERDPRSRLHDIADARIVLEEVVSKRGDTEVLPTPAGTPTFAWLPWVVGAAGFATALVVLLLGWSTSGPAPGRPLSRTSILMPTTDQPGRSSIDGGLFALSPDGSAIALVVGRNRSAVLGANEGTLFIRELAESEPQELAATKGAIFPFWSPDSQHIAFFAGGFLRRIPRGGGAVQTICPAKNGRGGAWSPEGIIVFADDPFSALLKVSATGGEPVAATLLDTDLGEKSHRFPAFLPDGRHFFFGVEPWETRMQVKLASLDEVSSGRPLLEASAVPVFALPDDLVFRRDAAIVAQKLDLDRLATVGEARLLEDRPSLMTEVSSISPVEISNDARLLYASDDARPIELSCYNRQGGRTETPVKLEEDIYGLEVSHRGDRLVAVSTEARDPALWILDPESGDAFRVTAPGRAPYGAVWSADDRQIATNLVEGVLGLGSQGPAFVNAESGEIQRPIEPSSGWIVPTDLSADGRFLVYVILTAKSRDDIGFLRLDEEKPALNDYLASPAAEFGADLSPDGRFLAYLSDVSGRTEVYIDTFPEPSQPRRIATGGAALQVAFRADGKELFVVADVGSERATLFAIPFKSSISFEVDRPLKLFSLPPEWHAFAPSPSGDRFYLLEPHGSHAPSLTLVDNWRAQLEAKP